MPARTNARVHMRTLKPIVHQADSMPTAQSHGNLTLLSVGVSVTGPVGRVRRAKGP